LRKWSRLLLRRCLPLPDFVPAICAQARFTCDIVLATEISHLAANRLFCAIKAQCAWHASCFSNPILQHGYSFCRSSAACERVLYRSHSAYTLVVSGWSHTTRAPSRRTPQGAPPSLAAGATRAPSRLTSPPSSAAGVTLTCAL